MAAYNEINANYYFWRTYDKQEIDLIEETSGQLNAYEFKWNANKKVKVPKAFSDAYINAKFNLVNPDNFVDYI